MGTQRFARPWEDPPIREVPSALVKIKEDNIDATATEKTQICLKQEKIHQPKMCSEDFEVFHFDRDSLVLRSEKKTLAVDSQSNMLLNTPSLLCSVKSENIGTSEPGAENRNLCDEKSVRTHGDNDLLLATKEEEHDVRDLNSTGARELEQAFDIKVEDKETDEDEEEDLSGDQSLSKSNSEIIRKSSRLLSTKASFCNKSHEAQVLKKMTHLLKKVPDELTEEDRLSLNSFPELAAEAKRRLEKRRLATERIKEEEDPVDILDQKCLRLASVISKAKYLVVYTGAGISTSASIPDYRGPNGIWTLLRKGLSLANDQIQFPQSADPTFTHMAIKELHSRKIIQHIVSQNVDGLHLRSGIPKKSLSEVHGNMHIEVCLECHREYVRLFDVTENTRRHYHKTGRFCYYCGSPLKDSVVLFGEKGSLRWPINWAGAEYHVDKADVILCLGSSLKVLRRYPWLWGMSKPAKDRPKLIIVNLQWTPKDRYAALKINGRCDQVMGVVMDHLKISVPLYQREKDAIFTIATCLHPSESSTKQCPDLSLPDGCPYPDRSTDLSTYFRYEPTLAKEVLSLVPVKRKLVDDEKPGSSKTKHNGGIGWLGNNALSIKSKKKKKSTS